MQSTVARVPVEGNKVTMWDLGGQTSLRVIWNRYYSEAHAVMFMVDSEDKKRIEEAKEELQAILSHPELDGAPVVILANKQDLRGAMNEREISTLMEVRSTKARPMAVFPIIAKDGYVFLPFSISRVPSSILFRLVIPFF